MSNILNTVKNWVFDNHPGDVDGWALGLQDLALDRIGNDETPLSAFEEVEQWVSDIQEAPEYHGCPIPIYYDDLETIFERNESDCEDLIREYCLTDTCETTRDAQNHAAAYLVDRAYSDAGYALESALDELREVLGVDLYERVSDPDQSAEVFDEKLMALRGAGAPSWEKYFRDGLTMMDLENDEYGIGSYCR